MKTITASLALLALLSSLTLSTGCASTGGAPPDPSFYRALAVRVLGWAITCAIQPGDVLECVEDVARQQLGGILTDMVGELLSGVDLGDDAELVGDLAGAAVSWVLTCALAAEDVDCVLDSAREWAGARSPELADAIVRLVEELLWREPPATLATGDSGVRLLRIAEECQGQKGCMRQEINAWHAQDPTTAGAAMRLLAGDAAKAEER